LGNSLVKGIIIAVVEKAIQDTFHVCGVLAGNDDVGGRQTGHGKITLGTDINVDIKIAWARVYGQHIITVLLDRFFNLPLQGIVY
jgi:hypothetical protein